MPHFDELSVINLWPDMQKDEIFMKYMPSRFPKGRLPDRTYFFNILNTIMEPYVAELIKHANLQRTTAKNEAQAIQTIEVTDEWYQKLQSIPFISRKS